MKINFHKMHGAGNDFVLLDLRRQAFNLDAETARALAHRQTGIGCDQLLVLQSPEEDQYPARFEVWNADGSRAEQCGNGVRCIALYLRQSGELGDATARLLGPAGTVEVRCLEHGLVRVNMGTPDFRPRRVPIHLAEDDGWYRLPTAQGEVRLGAVSMGNPHAVVPVASADATDVQALGAAIGAHPAFPEGCNAGFAEVVDSATVHLRVFERGTGETRACGSGACAAVAVLSRHGLVESKVRVIQDGGELIIGWSGGQEPMFMTGPAVHVFEGTLR